MSESMGPVFLAAARDGDVGVLRLCLEDGTADFSACDEEGNTALHLVAAAGHVDALCLLLQHDVDNKWLEITNKAKQTPLLSALSVDVVRELVMRGADVNAVDRGSNSALILACSAGMREVAQELVARGADLDIVNEYGCTALHYASNNGDTMMVKHLLEAGARVHAENAGPTTALHVAASKNHVEVAEVLLQHGIDVNALDEASRTALTIGLREERFYEFAKLLLEHGAGTHIPDYARDHDVLLHQACDLPDGARIVKLLLEHGADPLFPMSDGPAFVSAAGQGRMDIVELLMDNVDDTKVEPYDYCRLLVRACSMGYRYDDIVLKLLRRGEHILLANYSRILIVAAAEASMQVLKYILEVGSTAGISDMPQLLGSALFGVSNLDRLSVLLELGADKHATTCGYTALHGACENGTIAMMEKLLAIGLDPNAIGPRGETTFRLASKNENKLKLLITYGFDVNQVNSVTGMTPLLQSVDEPSVIAAKILLDHGADPSATFSDGWTLLHHCCEKASSIVELLLERGFDASARDVRGFTPLHAAVGGANSIPIPLLVQHGADINARTQDGKTALDLCLIWEREKNPIELVNTVYTLILHGAEYDSSEERSTDVFAEEELFNASYTSKAEHAATILYLVQFWMNERAQGKNPLTELDWWVSREGLKAVKDYMTQASEAKLQLKDPDDDMREIEN